jgi:hypothetical protein
MSASAISAEKLNFINVSACLAAKKFALDEKDKAQAKLDSIYQPLSREFAEAAQDFLIKSNRYSAISSECSAMQSAENSTRSQPSLPKSRVTSASTASPTGGDAAAALAKRYDGTGGTASGAALSSNGNSSTSLTAIMAGGGQDKKLSMDELAGERLDAAIAYDKQEREYARIAELQRRADERQARREQAEYEREQAEYERERELEKRERQQRVVNALSGLGTTLITGRVVPPSQPVSGRSSAYDRSSASSYAPGQQSGAACSATLAQIREYRVTISDAEAAARSATSPGAAGGGATGSGIVSQANEIAQMAREAIQQNQAWYDANCR